MKSRNPLNSLIVLFVLIIVVACSCPNVRDENVRSGDDTQSENSERGADNAKDDSDKNTETAQSEKPDRGDFVVKHSSIGNSRYETIDRQIRDAKVLEKAADKLNRTLSLPEDITLQTKDCGEPNAFYNPRDKSITFCYELMERFYLDFKSVGNTDQQANEAMNKAVNYVFLHELGHALIDNYDLTITANEEDAADRCSSYICIEELGQDGVESILAAADAFRIQSQNRRPDQRHMADEHLLAEQRFFNSLCMVYGSDPDKYSNIVSQGYLPKARAARCPTEYNRIARSWEKLLEPWRKD